MNRAVEPAVPRVTFYTKAGCHLDDIAALTTFELTEIDIRSDNKLFEHYRYRIPVIIVDDDTILEGRIKYRELAWAFHV